MLPSCIPASSGRAPTSEGIVFHTWRGGGQPRRSLKQLAQRGSDGSVVVLRIRAQEWEASKRWRSGTPGIGKTDLDPPRSGSAPFRGPRGAKDNERQTLGIPTEVRASCAPRGSSGRIARPQRIGTLTRSFAGQNLPPNGQFNRCRTFARVPDP
jgi:hypothetical protein